MLLANDGKTQLHYHTDVWDGYLFAVSGPRWKKLSEKQHNKTSPSLTRHHAVDAPAESPPAAALTLQNYKNFLSVHFSTAAVAETSGKKGSSKKSAYVCQTKRLSSQESPLQTYRQHHHQFKCHLRGASENTVVST